MNEMRQMPDTRLSDETYLWRSQGLTDVQRWEREKSDLAALRRKITYCLSRPDERIQFQHVEGWTTGHIIGYMRGRGLDIERIRRSLAGVSYSPSEATIRRKEQETDDG
jgi:hypothetical protein